VSTPGYVSIGSGQFLSPRRVFEEVKTLDEFQQVGR